MKVASELVANRADENPTAEDTLLQSAILAGEPAFAAHEDMYSTPMHKGQYVPLIRAGGAILEAEGILVRDPRPAKSFDKTQMGRKRHVNNDGKFNRDSMSLLLEEVGEFPLIDKEKEYELGRRMRHARFVVARLALDGLRAVNGTGPMYSPEDKDLIIIKEGLEAKKELIQANLRLAISIAKRYNRPERELIDLVQEAILGVEHAADKFDETKGFKFSTYATSWIKQGLQRYINKTDGWIRLPEQVYQKREKIMAMFNQNMPLQEIAEQVDETEVTVLGVVRSMRSTESIDAPINDSELATHADMVPDEESGQEYIEVEDRFLAAELDEFIRSVLTEQEAEVLRLHFGLQSGDQVKLSEIAERSGVTKQRISAIRQTALRKLRHSNNVWKLEQFRAS